MVDAGQAPRLAAGGGGRRSLRQHAQSSRVSSASPKAFGFLGDATALCVSDRQAGHLCLSAPSSESSS